MNKDFEHMSDGELEKLFREGLSNYKPPPVPEGAWEDFVKNKLSPVTHAPKKKWHRGAGKNIRRFFTPAASWQFISLCSLLFVIGTWYGIGIWRENNSGSKQSITEPATAVTPDNGKKDSGSQVQVDSATIAHDSTVIRDTSMAMRQRNVKVDQNMQRGNLSINNNALPKDSNKQENRNSPYAYPGYSKMDKSNSVANAQPLNTNNKAIDSLSAHNNIKTEKNKNDDKKLSSYVNDRKVQEQNKGDKPKIEYASWQIGLVGGANISITSGTVANTAGYNAGVMVQHRIKQSRISVESGVVVESMNYKVANNNFNPSGSPVSPEFSNIRGNCTMIDVPVNIRYDVIQTRKGGNAFVSAGVSTMLMAKQSYSYLYGTNTTEWTKNVTGQGNNIYNTTNISVGYEQKWKRTSLQIAPYYKIPIGKIGYGNLRLGGMGIQISLKRDF